MSRIMCTQKLWRALGHSGSPPVEVEEPKIPDVVLGTWAVTLFHYDRRGFVLALNQQTYLTLVFPLAPRSEFRRNFATAFEWALLDLRVSIDIAIYEAEAVDFFPLARLTDRSMTGSLNDLEFLAQCELDYTDDLRRVQVRLNEVPHVNREPSTPCEAVAQAFAGLPVLPRKFLPN